MTAEGGSPHQWPDVAPARLSAPAVSPPGAAEATNIGALLPGENEGRGAEGAGRGVEERGDRAGRGAARRDAAMRGGARRGAAVVSLRLADEEPARRAAPR